MEEGHIAGRADGIVVPPDALAALAARDRQDSAGTIEGSAQRGGIGAAGNWAGRMRGGAQASRLWRSLWRGGFCS
jgi:hypothetical protein